jgi:hypothetical protein
MKGARRLIGRDRPSIVVEASAPHLARAGHSVAALYDELSSQDYAMYEIQRSGRLRELDCRPNEEGSRNWLCLHRSTREQLVARSRRSLMLAALMPMVPGLNPLTHPRFRKPLATPSRPESATRGAHVGRPRPSGSPAASLKPRLRLQAATMYWRRRQSCNRGRR